MRVSGQDEPCPLPSFIGLTCDDLDGLNSERICVDLTNGIHSVAGCVKALQPEDENVSAMICGDRE